MGGGQRGNGFADELILESDHRFQEQVAPEAFFRSVHIVLQFQTTLG